MVFRHLKNADKKNGQGLLEFALILPIFMLLLVGIMEVARLVYFNAAVGNASRDAVRYAAGSGTSTTSGTAYYRDCAGIRARAKTSAVGLNLQDSDIAINYDKGPDSNGNSIYLGDCDTYTTSEDLALGDRVSVTVTKTFNLIFPIFNWKSSPISSTSVRTIIKNL